MTTNGYLLDCATAQRLIELGVTSYQISLDGPAAIHNRTRVKANRSGSFAQIWSNLLALRDTTLPYSIMIRIHFSPDTALTLDRLIDDINREFCGDHRFSIYFKSIERLGGANDTAIRVFSERMQDEAKRYFDGKLSQVSCLTTDESYICYASKANSLVVRANGDIAKCTVALYDKRNKIGILRSAAPFPLISQNFRRWMGGFGTLDERALACPYSAMNKDVKGKATQRGRI